MVLARFSLHRRQKTKSKRVADTPVAAVFVYASIVGLFSVFAVPARATDLGTTQSGRAVLEKFLNNVTTFQASFKQTLFDEYGESLEDSAGQVVLAKPGKFRWEYQTPYRQVIVSNGQLIWVYDEDLEQVTVNKIPPQSSRSPLALLVDGAKIDETYHIEQGAREGDLQWLKLSPLFSDSEYQSIEIGVNDTDVVAMRLHDNLNQLTALRFQEISNDVEIDQQIFEFSIPTGVDVVNGIAE